MAKTNLDALILREDFEVEEGTNSGKKKETISIEDIKADSFFFTTLRKPDFQRETNEWESSKVSEFIHSFVAGDLIPAIILWRSSGGYLFVIDGSHRLSALSAWVNDDYGDKEASKRFYDGIVPDEQIKAAENTRKLVNKMVGSYSDLRLALTNPEKFSPETNRFARNLAALAVQLQWVEGDASRAQDSFFNINQQAAPIDKTELKLLKDRRKPSSIAARAIIRSGTGHRYWSAFSVSLQSQIQELAEEINAVLFKPLFSTPIKSLDLPIAGKVYSAQTLPMIVEMIGIVTGQRAFIDDSTGETTVEVLRQVRRVARLLNSNHASSLGLHPAVYFYSIEGRHKSASFLAFTDFIMDLDKRRQFGKLTSVRVQFENFILGHEYLVQQINRKYRTAQKSYEHISSFFSTVLEALVRGKSTIEDMTSDLHDKGFGYLSLQKPELLLQKSNEKFDADTKSAIYLRDVLKTAPRCAICGGYIHRTAISFDHINRRRDGGSADANNGQLTHPYCNTGLKS